MTAPPPTQQAQEETPEFSESAIKAAEKFLDFLKNETDRLNLKARLYEDRSRTYATFALAGGTIVSLLRPEKFTLELTAALVVVAILTLCVVGVAVAVNWSREGTAVGLDWLRRKQEEIRTEEYSYMDTLHQFQTSYINIVEKTHNSNDSKSRILRVAEFLVVVQIFSVVVYIGLRIGL